MSEWLAVFENMAETAIARGETDLSTAIEAFRQAIEAGTADKTCEYEWVSEIYSRVINNKKPVTEREYARLVAWYDRYRLGTAETPATPGLNDPNLTMMIHGYNRGSRRFGATEAVVRLRKLRREHPELLED